MARLDYYLMAAVLISGVCCSIQDIDVQHYDPESCNINELQSYNLGYCQGQVGNRVAHSGYCLVYSDTWENQAREGQNSRNDSKNLMLLQHGNFLPLWKIECRRGRWSEADTSLGQSDSSGGGSSNTVTKYPPEFPTPCTPADLKTEYYTASGQSDITVRWTQPTATDKDGGTPTVMQVSGRTNGGTFEGAVSGKEYYIVYEARDSDGLKDNCYFSFTVKVKVCSSLPWPKDGNRVCQQDNILGSTCDYSCDEGFELRGANTVTCQNQASPSWSAIPFCAKKRCGIPGNISNGVFDCEDDTYQSICMIRCYKGYALEGSMYIRCKADGTWSTAGASFCKDNTPPKLFCLSPQTFYADRGVNSAASVTWQLPTAVDATDKNVIILQTSGPTQATTLQIGTHLATYKAIDSDGNESPECSVELRINALTCGHPFDAMEDNNMRFSCSNVAYLYGVACQLSCVAHLPLNGTDLITCEKIGPDMQLTGVWSWGSGPKPYCREIACPKLDPPINGALIYDSTNWKGLYTMQCNKMYDIPDVVPNFIGMFLCKDSGEWSPNCSVPDCIVPRNIRLIRLPSELYYYSGNCSDNATLEQIKQNLQKIITNDVGNVFSAICPSGETCRADSATIQCGPISGRKRKSIDWELDVGNDASSAHIIVKRQATHLLVFKFNIIVDVQMGNKTLTQALQYYDDLQLNKLKPAIQQMVTNGTFNLAGFDLSNDSFMTMEYGEIVCPDGYLFKSQTCKPCPLGYFLSTANICVQCAVGEYVDVEASVTCKSCPAGYSTKKTGSKFYNDCTQLCSPGSYSPDGMINCSVCSVGFYQDKQGQTSCKQCPHDTTTMSNNNRNISDCQYFDVLLYNSSNSEPINHSATEMTFMMWAKRADDGESNITVKLTSGSTHIFTLNLGTLISVSLPSINDTSVGPLNSTSWTHVAFSWDTAVNTMSIYRNGVAVKTLTIPPSTAPLLQNGSMYITAIAKTGVYISGLHLLNKTMSATTIQEFATSCHVSGNNDIINMNIFRDSNHSGIIIATPSACDAIDECQQSPCGNHSTACINGQDSFRCICLSGWTGVSCSIPPDYCINNTCQNAATCVSGYANYTCTCQSGYTGMFCELPPVDGSWSTWSQWSQCSVTCGTTSRSRARYCNSPPPDNYGKDCPGSNVDVEDCNQESCPVCPPLKRKYGTFLKCSTNQTTGFQTCQLFCADDKLLPNGLRDFQEFRCGMETNYVWQTMDNVPSCVEPVGPYGYTLTTTVLYTNAIALADQNSVQSQLQNNIQTLNCSISSNCATNITLSSVSTRRRRSSGTMMAMTFTIKLDLGSNIQYSLFVFNQTVNNNMQDAIKAIIKVESIVQYIYNHTNSIFDVVIGGVTYSADVSSLKIIGSAICNPGYAATDGFCVECPSGTYSNNGVCSFCERGTYQTLSGQIACITCPTGLTTDTIGSDNSSKCSQPLVTTTASENPENQEQNVGLYIGIAILVVAAVVAGVVGAVLCLKKAIWKNTPRSPSVASFLKINRDNTSDSILVQFNYNQNTSMPPERFILKN